MELVKLEKISPKNQWLLILLMSVGFFCGCEQEKQLVNEKQFDIITNEVLEVTSFSCLLSGTLILPEDNIGDFVFGFELSTNDTFNGTGVRRYYVQDYDSEYGFTKTIGNGAIVPSQQYYVRTFLVENNRVHTGVVIPFITDSIVVNTGNLDLTDFSIESQTNLPEKDKIRATYGICYSTKYEPYIYHDTICSSNINDKGLFKVLFDDDPFGIIRYKAFVYIDGIAFYGNEQQCAINTINITAIDSTTNSIHGKIQVRKLLSQIRYGIKCLFLDHNVSSSELTYQFSLSEITDSCQDFSIQIPYDPLGRVLCYAYTNNGTYNGTNYYNDSTYFKWNDFTVRKIDEHSILFELERYKPISYISLQLYDQNNNLRSSVELKSISDTLTPSFFTYGDNSIKVTVSSGGRNYYSDIVTLCSNDVHTGVIDTTNYHIISQINNPTLLDSCTYGINLCYSSPQYSTENLYAKKTILSDKLTGTQFETIIESVPVGVVSYQAFVKSGNQIYYGQLRTFEGNKLITTPFDISNLEITTHVKFTNSYYAPTFGICYGGWNVPTISYSRYVLIGELLIGQNLYKVNLPYLPFGEFTYRPFIKDGTNEYYGDVINAVGNMIEADEMNFEDFSVNVEYSYPVTSGINNVGISGISTQSQTITSRTDNGYKVLIKEIPNGDVTYTPYINYFDGTNTITYFGNRQSFKNNYIETGEVSNSYDIVSRTTFPYNRENTICGVCLSANSTPTVLSSYDKKVIANTIDEDGSFTVNVKNARRYNKDLKYYRAYINVAGTIIYGPVKTIP